VFYLILIIVICILGGIRHKISGSGGIEEINNEKELLKTVKYFVISYVVLEFLNFIFQLIEKKLKRDCLNCFFWIIVIFGIIVTVCSFCKNKTVFWSFLILYILIPSVIWLLGLRIKDIKYIGIKSKIMFGNYIVYSFLILICIKFFTKWDDLKYLTFQLIIFCKVFDYLKDTIVSTFIGWNLKEINRLKQLIENNTVKIKKEKSEELIEQLKEFFEVSDIKNIKKILVELSKINSDYLYIEKLKIKNKGLKFKKKNKKNKKLCKKLDKVLNRKFETIIEFQIYNADIEKIIAKVGD
jgi:membrane protein